MRWDHAEERHEQYAIDRACQDTPEDRVLRRERVRNFNLATWLEWQKQRTPGYRARYVRRDDSDA